PASFRWRLRGSEQLRDRLCAEIHERERAALRTRQVSFDVEAEAVENGRDDFFRLDGALGGEAADLVALADGASAFHSAAGEVNAPALRPVIAPAGGIHLRR